jgi:hypothetical protein
MSSLNSMAQNYERPLITPDASIQSPQYKQFVLDLQRCWDLTGIQPDNLVWSSRHPNNSYYNRPGNTRVSFSQFGGEPVDYFGIDGRPDLAIITFASHNNQRQGPEYHAPLIVDATGPKDLSATQLPDYEIRWNAEDRLIDPSARLEKILKDELNITGDKTPVLEVVAFMPVSKEPDFYETQFLPQLTSGKYGYFAIVEDRMPRSGYTGSPIRIHDKDEHGKYNSFSLSFVPDMSALEASLLPSHHGHMIIAAKGVKIKREEPQPFYQLPEDRSYGGDSWPSGIMGGGFKGGGSPTRGFGSEYVPRTQIGDTSIGSGSETRDRFKKVEAEDDLDTKPFLFHVKTIGVRRLEEGGLSEAMIAQLFNTVHSFPVLN